MCFPVPAPDQEFTLDYETLIYEQDEHVVTLTYNRPDQHNAISRRMNEELQHAWTRFRDDDSAFVLVITGAGETTFSAGWDLADAAELSEPPDWESWRREVWNSPGPCPRSAPRPSSGASGRGGRTTVSKVEGHGEKVVDADRGLRRHVHAARGRDDRQRRAAQHPARPRRQPDEPAVGRRRLRADALGADAHGRLARRPPGPPPG